jgi:membrane dipeptidase
MHRRHRFIVCILFFWSSCFVLSCSQSKLKLRALDIHREALTIDTHCDTPMRLLHGTFEMGQRHDTGKRGSGKIDLPRMAEGGLDCEFFAVFLGQGERTPKKHAMAKAMADSIITAVEDMCSTYPDLVELATTPDDAFRLEKLGKRAAFLGMENGYPIGKDISLIDYFYNRGIRYITLCHSANNEICDSSTDEKNGPEWNGLSPFGEKVVGAMNRLGMIIDVSHLSDSSFYDVIRLSRAPVVASHSCCRALCDHPRNLTDDMLTALAKNGGVIQICFVSSFVKETKPNPRRDAAIKKEREAIREKYGDYDQIEDPKIKEEYRNAYYSLFDKYPQKQATVKDLVNHIDHVVKLIGIDHVGIGTDFDGGGGLDGCNDVSELPNVTIELVRRGYSEEDIRKIWGGNFIRAFREIIEVGRKL